MGSFIYNLQLVMHVSKLNSRVLYMAQKSTTMLAVFKSQMGSRWSCSHPPNAIFSVTK